MDIDWAASRWVVDMDYARGRAGAVTYQDCAMLVNHATATVTHVQIMFGAADGDGSPKRPNLPLDMTTTIKPGRSASELACRPDGYANGDRGLWLVAWINEVDFADGTSWHAPPEKDIVAATSAALEEHAARH